MSFFSRSIRAIRSAGFDWRPEAKRPTTFWRGLKYLYFFTVLCAFFIMLRIVLSMVITLPHVGEFSTSLAEDLANAFPPDLVLTVEHGSLRMNADAPVTVEIPPTLTRYVEESFKEPLPHLVMIDPDATAEEYMDRRAFVLLTGSFAVLPDRSNNLDDEETLLKLQLVPYGFSDEPTVIDDARYRSTVTPILALLGHASTLWKLGILFVFVCAPFLIAAPVVLGWMITFLLTSLLLWVVALIAARPYGFGKLYILSFSVVTLPLLLMLALSLLDLRVRGLPTLLFLVLMLLVIFRTPKKHQS